MHLPNIETALKIKVIKNGKQFRADAKALPGTPLVGIGKTKDAAKYNLCVNWLYLIARYYADPECERTGSDYGYVPIILDILKEDWRKIYD